jgi:hypothetical protein
MRIVGFLKVYCDEHDVDVIVIDDTGVGGGVVDRLREVRPRRARIVGFIAGEKAKNPVYFANRVTEVWWVMRKRYLSGEMDTDDDAALIGQVSSRRFTLESEGALRLESKEKLHRSPDEADALAMTFAATRGGVKV